MKTKKRKTTEQDPDTYDTIQNYATDDYTDLEQDRRGRFHLVTRWKYVDGKRISYLQYDRRRTAAINGNPQPGEVVTRIVRDVIVTGPAAARAFINGLVPPSLRRFLKVR